MNKILLLFIILFLLLFYLYYRRKEKYSDKYNTIYIDNNLLKLYNIDSQADEIITELKENGNIVPCTSDVMCKRKSKNSECRWMESYRCGIIVDTSKMWEHINSKSYIQLTNIDSLNIELKFTFFLNSLGTQLIARSSLDVWRIYIIGVGGTTNNDEQTTIPLLVISTKNKKDDTLINETILSVDNKKFIPEKNVLYDLYLSIDNNELKYELSFKDNNNIYTRLNGVVPFYKENSYDENIYNCIRDSNDNDEFMCGPYPNECRIKKTNSGNTYYCIFDKNHSILFGQPNILDKSDTSNYFDGYIGRFIFDKDKLDKKECHYEVLDTKGYTQDICKQACIGISDSKTACTKEVCEEKCKDVRVCGFDSKINPSNHQIDCLNKCNLTDSCNNEYCIDQCTNCNDDCYWIAKNYNLNGKKNLTPRMAYITLSSTSYDGTKATIRWRKPCKSDEICDIIGYIMFVYKTYNKQDGINIIKIDGVNCLKNCEYEIPNLLDDISYTVALRAYNPMGLGQLSNLLTFTTYKKSINMDILDDI